MGIAPQGRTKIHVHRVLVIFYVIYTIRKALRAEWAREDMIFQKELRDYHHSICREMLPKIDGSTFSRLKFSIYGPILALPFLGLNIFSGRQDYHHSIHHEILLKIGGLTFLPAQILNFPIFGPNKAFMGHFGT